MRADKGAGCKELDDARGRGPSRSRSGAEVASGLNAARLVVTSFPFDSVCEWDKLARLIVVVVVQESGGGVRVL